MPDTARSTRLADRTRLARIPVPAAWIPLALNGLLLVLFLGAGIALVPAVTELEATLVASLGDLRTPALDALALGIAFAFSPPAGTLVLLGLFAAQLFIARAPVNAVATAVVMAPALLAVSPLTLLFPRPRPSTAAMDQAIASHVRDDSFPSSHTAVATAVVIGCALLARRSRPAVAGVGAVVVLIVAASRVYAGAHYPTDVVAGAALAASVALGAAGVWNAIGMPVLRRLPALSAFGPIPASESGPRRHRQTFVSPRATS